MLIDANEWVTVTDERWVQRLISFNVSGQEDAFKTGIRQRDGRCVISGIVNTATRIVRENWTSGDTGRWITDIDDTNGVSKINSLRNGMLLRRDFYNDFDQCLISVNPDFKVVVFDEDMDGLVGRVLDPVCRDPNNVHHVTGELLKWYFRQSNMRGVGEPIFEHDFAGEDMIKMISMERRA
ncbi:hypothetical protein L211DRAFT_858686 [Terfezia boudieri ATCC MYA-4762]|uniref:HNH nuclease domain-containing protein n=1 Tax=Terfezia boudieri ATCC MYA-4762 TaxID=1051890 RepID=A0A3N4LS04_9PEZI|nr:hypothetical protein L211DRAFT_858686 [Terfezia boudieri ATCC MYA-4762]